MTITLILVAFVVGFIFGWTAAEFFNMVDEEDEG